MGGTEAQRPGLKAPGRVVRAWPSRWHMRVVRVSWSLSSSVLVSLEGGAPPGISMVGPCGFQRGSPTCSLSITWEPNRGENSETHLIPAVSGAPAFLTLSEGCQDVLKVENHWRGDSGVREIGFKSQSGLQPLHMPKPQFPHL